MTSQLALFSIAPTIDGIDARKVAASYSADLIATCNKVRRPVAHAGALWVQGSMRSDHYEVYQMVPLAHFDGEATTYSIKVGFWQEGDAYPGDYARNDPNGFYHGMTVQHGSAKYVLTGPVQLVPVVASGVYDGLEDGGRTRIGNTPEEEKDDDDDEYGDGEDGGEGEDVECECGDIVTRNDPYYATPCGTHCVTCMAAHVVGCGICSSEFAEAFEAA